MASVEANGPTGMSGSAFDIFENNLNLKPMEAVAATEVNGAGEVGHKNGNGNHSDGHSVSSSSGSHSSLQFARKESRSSFVGIGLRIRPGIDKSERSQDFIREAITCVNCSKPAQTIPIYQCKNGHVICGPCHSKKLDEHSIKSLTKILKALKNKCKACDTQINYEHRSKQLKIRNFVAEALLGELFVKCWNRENGCNEEEMQHKFLGTHLRDCPVGVNTFCRRMFCTENNLRKVYGLHLSCGTEILARDHLTFMKHLEEDHRMTGSSSGNGALEVNLNKAIEILGSKGRYDHLAYILFEGRMFVLKFKLSIAQLEISWKMLFLGSVKEAAKYRVHMDTTFQPPHYGKTGTESTETELTLREKRACKIQWDGGVISLYDGWKGKSDHKFILPWSTVQIEQKKMQFQEQLQWTVKAQIMKLANCVSGRPEPGASSSDGGVDAAATNGGSSEAEVNGTASPTPQAEPESVVEDLIQLAI